MSTIAAPSRPTAPASQLTVENRFAQVDGDKFVYRRYGNAGTGAYQDEGLTLQPCNSARTVWILDSAESPANAPAYFPIVSGSTTDFVHPFAMDLPQDEVASSQQILQIHVRHLQFLGDENALPDSQLWGAHFGPYTAGS
jgi:hypothetical protein